MPDAMWSVEKWGFRGLYESLTIGHLYDLHAIILSREVLGQSREIIRRLEYMKKVPAFGTMSILSTELQADLWELYALSRVNDFLLTLDRKSSGWGVYYQLRLDFFTAIGFDTVTFRKPDEGSIAYIPFHHEIVEVNAWMKVKRTGIRVVNVLWPGLRFGDMLFA